MGSKRGAGGNTSLGGPETRWMRKSGGETMDECEGGVCLPFGPKISGGVASRSLQSLPKRVSRRAQPRASSALAIFTDETGRGAVFLDIDLRNDPTYPTYLREPSEDVPVGRYRRDSDAGRWIGPPLALPPPPVRV